MFYGAISAKLLPQLVFATLARSYKLIVCRTLLPVRGSNVDNFNISLLQRERALSYNQQTLNKC